MSEDRTNILCTKEAIYSSAAQKAKWDAKMEAKRAKKRRPRMRMKAM